MDYKNRIHRLRQFMHEQHIEAAVVNKPMNQYYLTGFITITYARPIVTVVEMDTCSMILPGIEEDLAKQTSIADRYYPYFEHPDEADKGLNYLVHLNAILKRYKQGTRIGIELGVVSAAFADALRNEGYELVEIGPYIMEMRMIKEPAELDIIREAGRIASLGVAATIEHSLPGRTETDIDQAGTTAATLEVIKKFPDAIVDKFTMSPSGPERTYLPHAPSGMRKLEPTDMVLHNRQLIINGYHAECQRTYFLGKPTVKQKELFNVAREAQQAAIDAVRPGIMACELDAVARAVIQKAGYGPLFNHRVGKGVGLEMLEEPYLRFDNQMILQENMAISLHPGIYYEGEGGFRHSDTLIITKTGSEVVTHYPKDLIDLIF